MASATLSTTETEFDETVWAAALPVWKILLFTLMVSCAAINPVDFKTDPTFERATESISGATLIKLGIAAALTACGFFGIFFGPAVRRLFWTLPGISLLLLCGIFIVSSIFAPAEVQKISLGCSLIYCGYLFFTATCVAHLGWRVSVAAVIFGTGLYLLATWYWYLTEPILGRFVEPVPGGITVERMGGMGHPNHVARNAISLGLVVLGELVTRTDQHRARWFRVFLVLTIAFTLATVYMTISRTATLAGLAAGFWMLMDRFWGRGGIAAFVTLSAVTLAAILGITLLTGKGPISAKGLSAVTKSGDIEEITSFTGRTVIWQEAIELSIQRPLTGWGMDSAASVLSNNHQACHNLYLNMAFSGGMPALFVVLGLIAWSVMLGISSPHYWIRGLMGYVMISSIVEDTLLDMFPPALTLLWIIALMVPLPEIQSRDDASSEAGLSDLRSIHA